MPNAWSSILIGFLSGLLSGFFVYWITKKREEKRATYFYWLNYLFGIMKECEVYIPSEQLAKMSMVGGKGSRWHDAIFALLDEINPYALEDREFDEREDRIAKNMLIALAELEKWKKKNCL